MWFANLKPILLEVRIFFILLFWIHYHQCYWSNPNFPTQAFIFPSMRVIYASWTQFDTQKDINNLFSDFSVIFLFLWYWTRCGITKISKLRNFFYPGCYSIWHDHNFVWHGPKYLYDMTRSYSYYFYPLQNPYFFCKENYK